MEHSPGWQWMFIVNQELTWSCGFVCAFSMWLRLSKPSGQFLRGHSPRGQSRSHQTTLSLVSEVTQHHLGLTVLITVNHSKHHRLKGRRELTHLLEGRIAKNLQASLICCPASHSRINEWPLLKEQLNPNLKNERAQLQHKHNSSLKFLFSRSLRPSESPLIHVQNSQPW